MTALQSTGNITLEQIYNKLKEKHITLDTKIPYSHPFKTQNKTLNMSLGRIWFNTLLPNDFKLIDEPIDKKTSSNIIEQIIKQYTSEEASQTITKIQNEAFKMATIYPQSFNINMFIPNPKWEEKKKQFQKIAPTLSDQEFIKQGLELTKEFMEDIEERCPGLDNGMKSKGFGSLDEIRMLFVSRGIVVDIENNIYRINEASDDGLSVKSYYKGGGLARRGYYIRTIQAAKPGYLTRKVTMASANISIKGEDCKTKKYYTVLIDKNNANKFINRYYMENSKPILITSTDQIINKTLKIRSPLYCQQPDGICQICYGTHNKNLNTNNIGILAGGAINNEALNQTMKTRHKVSQFDITEVDFPAILTKFSMNPETTFKDILKINKTEIFARSDIQIIINYSDYSEEHISNFGDHYLIPGIIDIKVDTDQDNEKIFTLPFSFKIKLYKSNSTIDNGSQIIINYVTGELIIKQETYINEVDPAIIDRIFEGGLKYINDPIILLNTMREKLPNMDSIHLELIVSNIFRSKEDNTIPSRLNNYKNSEIIGCKKLPHIDSWLNGLAFENPNKAIRVGLVKHKESTMNPIEKIIIDKYYTEGD